MRVFSLVPTVLETEVLRKALLTTESVVTKELTRLDLNGQLNANWMW